jgi:hypothetical protein
MDTNFHAFVFISTIVVYIILRSYKKSEAEDKKTSNLIYVLLVPVILYGGHYYYYFNKNTSISQDLNKDSISQIKESPLDDLLSVPYPVSSDSLSI